MLINHPADSFLGLAQWNDVHATKIIAPRLAGSTIIRPRLIDRLNIFRTYAVTLVVAPAGFGKTTLLVQWHGQPQICSAWLTMDGSERTVPQFVSNLAAAIIHDVPECKGGWERIRQMLQHESPVSESAIL